MAPQRRKTNRIEPEGASSGSAARDDTAQRPPKKQKSSADLDDLLLQNAECPICTNMLDCPVTTGCGHNFCESCLGTGIKVKAECPTCRQTVAQVPPKNTVLTAIVDGYVSKLEEGRQGELDRRLILAVVAGNSGRVEQLLAMGADPNAEGACKLKGKDDNTSRTALFLACYIDSSDGRRSCASALLAAGAQASNVDLFNAVIRCEQHQPFETVVMAMLAQGVTPDFVVEADSSYKGNMALLKAVQIGKQDLAVALVNAGAKLEVVMPEAFGANNGKAVIAVAAQKDMHKLVKLMLDKGAKIDKDDLNVARCWLRVFQEDQPERLR